MRKLTGTLTALLLFCTAKPESLAQHDVSIEFHDPINVYGDHDVDRGPRGEPGARGGSDGSRGGGRAAAPSSPAVRTTVVTVGGREFHVSLAANNDLAAFISEYRQVSVVGQLVSAFAGFFALFNLFSIDSTNPIAEAVHNPASTAFEPDELVLTLSATSTWNTAMRTNAVNIIHHKMLDAALKWGGKSEFEMWKALREVIEFPERYQDGGIRREADGRIIMRDGPGIGLRSIAGSQVFPNDQVPLASLTTQMLQNGPAHAWVWQADYWYHLYPGNGGVGGLTMRDEMLINQALFLAGPITKYNLRYQFSQLRATYGQSPMLWSRLEEYLDDPDAWRDYLYGGVPRPVDSMGFVDDLPRRTDLVTG